MDASANASFRKQLLDRRQRLTHAVGRLGEAADLVHLLQAVDGALSRLDHGQYGECLVCHEQVEEEYLKSHPLIQYCLCGLSDRQREALEADLSMASRIQWALLPEEDLEHCCWRTHFRYQPAGPVSGDFCDIIPCPGAPGDFYFIIGDVSGKGVAASLFMAHLNAIFRSLVEPGIPVEELVDRANVQIMKNPIASHYATLICGRARPAGEVEICNAGHCPPIVVGGGRTVPVAASGFPLGMFGGSAFTAERIALEPGESLFLYTDGLTEERGKDGEEYGVDRLLKTLAAVAEQEPGPIASKILEEASAFRTADGWRDDLTLLILRRIS